MPPSIGTKRTDWHLYLEFQKRFGSNFVSEADRQEALEALRRNDAGRRWFLEFKAKWLLEQGIIEVHGPANVEASADNGED